MLRRREFVKLLSGVAGATVLDGCLDPSNYLTSPDLDPSPPVVNSSLRGICSPAATVALGDLTVSTHPWPSGLDAAALIDVDDFCPVVLPGEGLDFGGDLSSNGILAGFLTDELLSTYPEVKINLMTIANMRQDPLSRVPIAEDDRYLLSTQATWTSSVRQILDAYPNVRLGMHGFWHFNYSDRGPDEFTQYSDLRAREVMRQMQLEFLKALPMVEPVFRAPGWATPPSVLVYVAQAGLLLADSSIAQTFNGSIPSCYSVSSNEEVIRAGPDFRTWIADAAQAAGFIVGHFHFTAPNRNSLGSDAGRRNALGFAKAVRSNTQYRIGWLSYYEAALRVALGRSTKWSAVLDAGDLVISVTSIEPTFRRVTLTVQNLADRHVAVVNADGDPLPFGVMSSARGCDYIVLDP